MGYYVRNFRAALKIYLLTATSSAEALMQETLKLHGEQIYHLRTGKISLSFISRLNSPSFQTLLI